MAEAVGLAASIASLVQIAASIARISYSYGTEVINAREAQKLYVQEVSSFISVLLRTQQALLDSESAGLAKSRPLSLSDDTIKNCHQELKTLERDLQKRANRFTWPFQERDLRRHIDALTRFRQIFSDYLSSTILNSSVVAYKKLQQVALQQEKQQLLILLGTPEDLSRVKPTACPGTGLWFLESEEYKTWRDQKGGVMWCFGAPGVGKSLLASIVIDDLRERQNKTPLSVAYYFCEFSSRERQSPLVILQALLRQLVEQAGEDVVMQIKAALSDPIKRTKEADLCKILAQACSLHPTYLVIDAPDELDKPRRLLAHMQPLVDCNAHVLITSREISEMKKFPNLLKIEARSKLEDIRKYLTAQFEEHELCEDDDTSEFDGLVDAIVSKSSNLFLLAKLFADRVLEQQTLRQMRKAVESFPDSLEAAYNSTLQRIDAQPKARKSLARRLLSWITRSMRRLRIEEIIEAFAVEEDADTVAEDNKLDAGRLLSSCHGIVFASKDDGTVGFIHTTAYEFFAKISSDADANADIGRTCLLYLSLKPFRSEIFSTAQQMVRNLEVMPFLGYAASYWGSHIQNKEAEIALQSRIMILKTGPPLHWACSRGNLDVAIVLIQYHAQVDAVDSQGWTPLFWAAFNCHVDLVRLLLDKGSNHLHRSALGWTALHWAISKRQNAVVEIILNHHASSTWKKTRPSGLLRDLTYQDAVCLSVKPIEIAASIGDTEIFDALTRCLDKSRLISDDISFNAIWSAEKFDHPIANPWRTLLKGEHEVPLGRYLDNPLSSRRFALEDNIAAANVPREWKSRLLISAIKDNKFDIARLLVHIGADVNYNDEASPLHAAVLRCDPGFCRQLIQMGANPESVDQRGFTPLHHAIMNGDTEVVLTLLQSGSSANTRAAKPADTLGGGWEFWTKCPPGSRTPLILSCGFLLTDEPREELALKIAELLILHGADATMADQEGRTPLHYAVVRLYPPLIECLLGAGARSDISDADGWTPFHDLAAAADIQYEVEWLRHLLLEMIEKSSDRNSARIFNEVAQGKQHYRYKEKVKASPTPTVTSVTLALENGHWKTFKVLQELGGRIPPSQNFGHALDIAVQDLEPEIIAILLDRGAVPEGKSIRSLVHSLANVLKGDEAGAVLAERFKTALWSLKSANVDFNERDPETGMTALLLAAKVIDEEKITEALVQAGADPTIDSKDSFSSIVTSAVHSRTKTLGALIRHLDAEQSPQPPHSLSDYEKLCWQLRKEGKIGASTSSGETFLHQAARAGNCELISCLMEYGADVNAMDNAGFTPIHAAGLAGSLDALKLLYPLETRLLSSATSLDSTLSIEVMSPRPQVDIDKTTRRGSTILDVAIMEHRTDLVRYLLQLGAQATRKDQRPGICLAAEKGYDDIVTALLDSGASADMPDPDGWTALHLAAYEGSEAVMQVLLSRGADISATTTCWGGFYGLRWSPSRLRRNEGWVAQPIHIAAISGHLGVVRLLLEHGADPNASTGTENHGPTALHIVLDTSHVGLWLETLCKEYLEIAQTLVEAGADVSGVANRFKVEDVIRFKGFEDLWDKLRVGITQ